MLSPCDDALQKLYVSAALKNHNWFDTREEFNPTIYKTSWAGLESIVLQLH